MSDLSQNLVENKSSENKYLIFFGTMIMFLLFIEIIISVTQLVMLNYAIEQLSFSIGSFENDLSSDKIRDDIVNLIEFMCNATKAC